MTDCKGCASVSGGVFIAGCRQCAVRSLAAGPLFFASMRAGKLTPEYQSALQALGEPAVVHAEVKAAAKGYTTGAAP